MPPVVEDRVRFAARDEVAQRVLVLWKCSVIISIVAMFANFPYTQYRSIKREMNMYICNIGTSFRSGRGRTTDPHVA